MQANCLVVFKVVFCLGHSKGVGKIWFAFDCKGQNNTVTEFVVKTSYFITLKLLNQGPRYMGDKGGPCPPKNSQ